MSSIQVNWTRLVEQGIDPQSVTKLVHSLEKAGFKVWSSANELKDLVALQKLTDPEPPRPLPASNAYLYQLATCFLLGAFSSLLAVFIVWWNLMVR
jgi:hypothetical protein